MDALIIMFTLVVVILFGGIFIILTLPQAGRKETFKKIDGTDFIPLQMLMGNDGLSGIAVNEHSRRICLLKTPSSSPRLLPVSALVGSHVIYNGKTLEQGLRSCPKEVLTFLREIQPKIEREITRLHAESSSSSNQRIDLLVLVHDMTNPIHVVNVLDMETKEGGIIFDKSINTAKHWHYLLDGLILQGDHQARLQAESEQPETNGSTTLVADELVKLGDLFDKKLITQYEFEAQKEKLLAGKP